MLNGISNNKSDQFLKQLNTLGCIKNLKIDKTTKSLSKCVKNMINYKGEISEYKSIKETITTLINKDTFEYLQNYINITKISIIYA